MIKVTLKDGSVREFNDNTDVISIAKDISEAVSYTHLTLPTILLV